LKGYIAMLEMTGDDIGILTAVGRKTDQADPECLEEDQGASSSTLLSFALAQQGIAGTPGYD
jgi:hypothetical protein